MSTVKQCFDVKFTPDVQNDSTQEYALEAFKTAVMHQFAMKLNHFHHIDNRKLENNLATLL